MKRDHTKISPTAFSHIIWRTSYGIPLADKFFKAAKKYFPRKYFFHKDIFSGKSKSTIPKTSPIFEGRYKGGEKALDNFIKRNSDCIVLELAAGFSLHGINLATKYPKITYIETDLLEMIRLKENIIREIGAKKPNLYFRSSNALDEKKINEIILTLGKSNSKIAFYCEGLLSYFSDQEKKKLAGIIRRILEKRGGVWITPDPALSFESRSILKRHWPDYKRLAQKAEKMAKQKYDNHGFTNERETDKFFRGCGFKVRKYNWPSKLVSWQTAGYEKKKETALKNILKKYGKVWVLTVN